jgi:hypothetical protein
MFDFQEAKFSNSWEKAYGCFAIMFEGQSRRFFLATIVEYLVVRIPDTSRERQILHNFTSLRVVTYWKAPLTDRGALPRVTTEDAMFEKCRLPKKKFLASKEWKDPSPGWVLTHQL